MATSIAENETEQEAGFITSIPEEETAGMLSLIKLRIESGKASSIITGEPIEGELMNAPIEVGKLIRIGIGNTTAVDKIQRLPDGFEIHTQTSTYKLTHRQPKRQE